MRDHRVNDLEWTWSGDFALSTQGDLADTSSHPLRSFIQEIRTRLRSELYDWKLHPHIGASMSDLIGEPNNEITAESGRVKIIAALTKDGLVAANLIKVRYTPVDRHHILYNILISVPDSTQDEIINLSFLLDIDEYEVTFLT